MQVHQIESWRALLSFRISDTLYHITIFQVVSIIYTDHYIIHQVSYYSHTVLQALHLKRIRLVI